MLINTGTGAVTKLTGTWSHAHWSPDGLRLALEVSKPTPSVRIFGLFPQPTLESEIPLDGELEHIVWSPSGQALLYHVGGGGTYVWRVGQDPAQVAQCTTHYDCDSMFGDPLLSFGWSQAGDRILFVGRQAGEWGLYVVNVDGSDLRKVVATDVAAAIWVDG
jgi:Tol biopolymer transport system component